MLDPSIDRRLEVDPYRARQCAASAPSPIEQTWSACAPVVHQSVVPGGVSDGAARCKTASRDPWGDLRCCHTERSNAQRMRALGLCVAS